MARADINYQIEQILTNGFSYNGSTDNFHRNTHYKGQKLSKQQLSTIKKYKEFYELKPSSKGGTIKKTTLLNALNCLRFLGLHIKKPFEKATTNDIISYFKQMHDDNKSEATIANYKVTVRSFYKWIHGITKANDFPEIVDNPLLVPQRPKPSKHRSPDNFLTKDEIVKMLNSCIRLRDKVLIMLTYGEGSMRAGEIVSLNYGSVKLEEKYCRVFIPESKSKERAVLLIDTFPYLRDYLNIEYQLGKTDKSPLFYSLASHRKNPRLSRGTVTEILKRVAKRAGITKNVFAHMGRHQSVTQMSNDGLSLQLNAKRAGIHVMTLNNVYLHHNTSDVDQAYLAIKGGLSDKDKVLAEEEKQKLTPRKCVRCGNINPADAVSCHCGAYLDLKYAEEIEEKRKKFEMDVIDKLIDDKIKLKEAARNFTFTPESIKLLKKIKNK